jgi:hypothetical protein
MVNSSRCQSRQPRTIDARMPGASPRSSSSSLGLIPNVCVNGMRRMRRQKAYESSRTTGV